MDKKYTFLFFGKTGSGKGTQGHLLEEYLKSQGGNVLYVETGARFRLFTEESSYTAKYTKDIMEHGGLLPDFLPVALWGRVFMEEYRGDESIIFDGLARRESEAHLLDSAIKFFKRENVFIIYINVSEDWAINVLKKRGRADDDMEDIKKKMFWFESNTTPSIQFFKDNKDYNFLEINGERTIEEIHKDIISKIFQN